MYRVRAEAVSGTKVFADGKWLTCIGNKPVHVGDRIWTDGRCVYGNYQTPQTPLIIYVEEKAIPILIYDKQTADATANYYSCTLDMELEQIISAETSEHLFLINDSEGNIYAGKRNTGYRNSDDWTEYGDEYRLDVNIDELGDLYELTYWNRVITDPDRTLWGMAPVITILGNEEELLEIDLKDIAQDVKSEAESLLEEPERSVAMPQVYPAWGVIEDKNNWAIIVGAYCDALVHYVELNPYNGAVVKSVWEPATVQNWYLYTPNGRQQLYHAAINAHGVQISQNSMSNTRLPIQDGYYFTIDSLENGKNPIHYIGTAEAEYTYLYPTYMNVSIFSPEEQKLFSGEFIMGTYFTICEEGLLGINTRGGRGIRWENFPYTDLSKVIEDSDFADGLYSIDEENNTLEPLISGVVRNWKLRPINAENQITDWEEIIPLEQFLEPREK